MAKKTVRPGDYTRKIATGLKKGTEYACHDGMRFTCDKAKLAARDQVEFLVVSGAVTQSDYYLLQAVYELRYASVYALLSKLQLEQLRHPDKAYFPYRSKKDLEVRLNELFKGGFLFYHEYVNRRGRVQQLYYCSSEGWRAFKTRLSVNSRYDKNTVYQPPYEVFRQAAANAVAFSFSLSPNCSSVVPVGETSYRENGQSKKAYVYGRTMVNNDDGTKSRYIIEPVSYIVPEDEIPGEQVKSRIADRILQLKKVVESYDDEEPGIRTYIIFLVEDDKGLAELHGQITQMELSFFLERCFFTSENVVIDGFRGDVEHAVLGLVYEDGSTHFSYKGLPSALHIWEEEMPVEVGGGE